MRSGWRKYVRCRKEYRKNEKGSSKDRVLFEEDFERISRVFFRGVGADLGTADISRRLRTELIDV